FRLQKALELGAALTVNARSQDALQVIMDATQQMGVDHAFEAVGLETTLTQALNVLKRGGAATLLGIFETPQVNIPANIFVQREISLNGSQGYNWDFQDALTLLETGSIDLKPLITHRLKPEQLQEGFEMLLSPGSEAIKVVFEYNQ
ncbi:MAG: zinc-binding dehydrogenase, partial [Anaerolineae bacterium]|nr:zinc-binding dehydrogenase [Anaerolineae bacterium]